MKILPLPDKYLNLRVARMTTQKTAVSSHATEIKKYPQVKLRY